MIIVVSTTDLVLKVHNTHVGIMVLVHTFTVIDLDASLIVLHFPTSIYTIFFSNGAKVHCLPMSQTSLNISSFICTVVFTSLATHCTVAFASLELVVQLCSHVLLHEWLMQIDRYCPCCYLLSCVLRQFFFFYK